MHYYFTLIHHPEVGDVDMSAGDPVMGYYYVETAAAEVIAVHMWHVIITYVPRDINTHAHAHTQCCSHYGN